MSAEGLVKRMNAKSNKKLRLRFPYKDSVDKEKVREGKYQEEAQKIVTFGIIGDSILCIIKIVVGFGAKSPALLADALHGLADLVGEFITLLCLSLSRLPSSYLFPYGYGKFEAFGLIVVAGVMAIAGVELIHESAILLSSSHDASDDNEHHLASREARNVSLDLAAALVSIFSILFKEMLYRMAVTEGKRQNSPLLESNAWHHRADAMSSLVALLGIVGNALGNTWTDPIAGIIVAILVLNVGVQVGWEAVQQLLDMSVSEEDLKKFKQMAKRCIAHSKDSEDIEVLFVRARKMGPHVMLTIELDVSPRIEFHRVSKAQEEISQYIQDNNKNVKEVLYNLVSTSPVLKDDIHELPEEDRQKLVLNMRSSLRRSSISPDKNLLLNQLGSHLTNSMRDKFRKSGRGKRSTVWLMDSVQDGDFSEFRTWSSSVASSNERLHAPSGDLSGLGSVKEKVQNSRTKRGSTT
mmetsp:Transcript_10223/g.18632  ORF Transcript_10223/g.18632 Transcript_10223/m.18632 type:complete len:466 (+) Transcript_10223:218-1615(+)